MTPHSIIQSPVFFVCMGLSVIGTRVYVSVCTYVQVCMPTGIKQPGVDIGHLPRSFFHFFFF